MRAALLALALAALPGTQAAPDAQPGPAAQAGPDDTEDMAMERVGDWSVGPTDLSCMAMPDDGSGLTLSRRFDAPGADDLDLTGEVARTRGSESPVPVRLTVFAADGREAGRTTLAMAPSEDGVALWLEDAPGDLFGLLRRGARAEFVNGRARLAVDVRGAAAALDALERCMAEHGGDAGREEGR